jgi:electron transfer flavoprotein alpha subunit
MSEGPVLCYSEEPELEEELLRFAHHSGLPGGRPVIAAVLGAPPGDLPRRYAAAGAQQVYQLSAGDLTYPDPGVLAGALAIVVREAHPCVVLVSSTKRGKQIAGRLAGLLDWPAETGVNALRREGGHWVLEREALSGNAVSVERFPDAPAVLAITPGQDTPPAPSFPEEVHEVTGTLPSAKGERRERRPKGGGKVHLETADRIVTVGRGLKRREDLPMIEALASALHAAVGCTRPLAAEAGWLSDDHWIGLTGHRVRPKLYLALGVSGAVQHLVGMRGSRIVVAVNQDANAPILGQADYRITADLYVVVPALLRALATPG